MADQEIRFILEAVDNASDKISAAAGKIEGDTKKALEGISLLGAAATAVLALSVKGALDEEEAITNAARATATAGGGFDKAKEAIIAFNKEMEAQGIGTDKSAEAVTLLVTKMGKDLPTALTHAADLISYAEANNLSLSMAVKRLNDEEKGGIEQIKGANAARLATLTTSDRMAIAAEKFGNIMERMGEKLIPAVEKALEFATVLMDGFEKLDPALQDIILVIGTVVAVILSLAGAVAFVLLQLAPFAGAIVGLFGSGGALAGVGAAIAGVVGVVASFATGIGEVLLVIGLVILIVLALKAVWDSNFLNMQNSLGSFVLVVTGITSLFLGVLALPIVALAALWAAWDNNWFGIRDTLTNVATSIGTTITEIITKITTFITDFTTKIVAFTTDLALKWTSFIAGIIAGIVKIGVDGIAAVTKFIAEMTKAFTDLIAKGLTWGADLVSNILKGIQEKAASIAAAAASAAASAAGSILGAAGGGIRIPGFAAGGVVDRPTLALLGEGGEREYVIPQSNVGQFAAAAGAGGAGTVSIVMNVYAANDPAATARMVSDELMSLLNASNSASIMSSKV